MATTETRVDWSNPAARYAERVSWVADHQRICLHCRQGARGGWQGPCGSLAILLDYVEEARGRMNGR